MAKKGLSEILDPHNREFASDIKNLDTTSPDEFDAAVFDGMAKEMDTFLRRGAERRAQEELKPLDKKFDADIAELGARNAPEAEYRALQTTYYEQRAAIIEAHMKDNPPLPLPERLLKEISSSEIGQKTQAVLDKMRKFFDDETNKLLVGLATATTLVAEGLGAIPPDQRIQTYAIVAGIVSALKLGSAGIDTVLEAIQKKSPTDTPESRA